MWVIESFAGSVHWFSALQHSICAEMSAIMDFLDFGSYRPQRFPHVRLKRGVSRDILGEVLVRRTYLDDRHSTRRRFAEARRIRRGNFCAMPLVIGVFHALLR